MEETFHRRHQQQHSSVALIVGVTGMVGVCLAEALKKPTARGGPWTVYGVSRRLPPTWFPSSAIDRHIQLDALDAADARKKLTALSDQITHVFWVALQSLESEEANIVANTAMLENVLDPLTSSSGSALRHVALQTGTKHYMGPIWDPIFANKLTPHETPFREDYPRLPFPCFYYDQEDVLASYKSKSYNRSLTWSVHRSSLILGASSASTYNTILVLAVYAAICRKEGTPFRFPGTEYTWNHFCDASDAGLLAEQQIWAAAATGDAAVKDQAYNCTNGDVFTWRSFWKALAEALGVEFVPFDPETEGSYDWVAEMKGKAAVWDEIVEEYGMFKTELNVAGFEGAETVLKKFKFQHVSSMNKSREFGFYGYVNTLKSVRRWVDRLREMKIIPKYV